VSLPLPSCRRERDRSLSHRRPSGSCRRWLNHIPSREPCPRPRVTHAASIDRKLTAFNPTLRSRAYRRRSDGEGAIRLLIALMVLCCDPLAIAVIAAASARRSTAVSNHIWSAAPSIADVVTRSSVTAAVGQIRTSHRQERSLLGSRCLFKIDTYAPDMETGSEDPSDDHPRRHSRMMDGRRVK
jgi:hypothetical protein